jgi:hypothetical protein
MAEDSLPYVNATGNITKVLNKIRDAETPTRFSQDYLATTLQMPGGSAKPLIPYLKRTGFLASDGTPTELYRRFRGAQKGGGSRRSAAHGISPSVPDQRVRARRDRPEAEGPHRPGHRRREELQAHRPDSGVVQGTQGLR